MLSVVAIVLLIALLAIGVPIFAALGVVSIGMLSLEGRPLFDAALTAIGGLNSSAFVAVLFFVVAAKFMESGGIARVLIEAAEAWVGRLRGGLGLVAVVGTTLFAAVSGSSVVTAMTMGTLLIPLMIAKRYDRPFALGTIGAAGTLGILIPPSLSMILYGLVANESVARLFLAGVVPEGWLVQPSSQFRLLNYRFGSGGEVAVGISAGDLPGNVNRWLAQFGRDPLDADAVSALEKIEVMGVSGVWVEAEGDYEPGMGQEGRKDQALAGVIADDKGRIITVKMTGPAAEVAAQKAALRSFVAGLRARGE